MVGKEQSIQSLRDVRVISRRLTNLSLLKQLALRLKASQMIAVDRIVHLYADVLQSATTIKETKGLINEFNQKTLDISGRMSSLMQDYPDLISTTNL